MGSTKYFGLSYFDFGDQLDSPLNIQKEIDRFVVIDKQLYGLYSVFGSGVISGWTVRDAGTTDGQGIGITVSAGTGIINLLAAETHIPEFIYDLTPNSILDIYASLTGSSSRDRTVNFVVSASDLASNSMIRLARMATGNNSILYIDNNVRDRISFDEIIEDQINQHKHRGTPSKIDLQEETRNQLPGSRIEGIDASKIISGQFDIERIPLIDHNNLENNGMLSHAALDSFIRTFSQNNKELLGEVTSVNLLKTIAFLKYMYANVDEQFVNELVIIPGISPNSFIDFESSTANINLGENCISGNPAQTGIFASIFWNTTFTFDNAAMKSNVFISDDTVSIARTGSQIDTVADFSNGICFSPEMVLESDTLSCDIETEEGIDFGRLGGGGILQYYYRLNLASNNHKDWADNFDELVIKVKTNQAAHEPVYMYLVNGSNLVEDGQSFGSIEANNIEGVKKPATAWKILEKDESMPEFEEKVFDITSLELNDVSQITIFTSDSFVFDIDDIHARRTNLLSNSGTIRFRYETEANVVFHSIFYSAETPEDSSVSIRFKGASSIDLLSRSSYSLPLSSGDIFAVPGKASEIEVVLTPNNEKTVSSVLNSVELRILTDADFNGFVIDRESDWERGTLENVTIQPVAGQNLDDLVITAPINVGGRHFMKNSAVSEINDNNIGVYGFSGVEMPLSPSQTRDWTPSSSRGFNNSYSAVRKFNNNFLIADTYNNRVLEVDSSGALVRGFGSTYSIDINFYPLSAIYNPVTKILTVVFTKAAVVSDITKISFFIGAAKLPLTADDVPLAADKGGGKVLEIQLDDDTAVNLVGVTSDLAVNFENGAFTENVEVNAGMSVVGNSIFSLTRGLICFVGEFTYVDNIRHPIFVNETRKGNLIIANSSIFFGEIDSTKEEDSIVPDIVEINPDNLLDTDDKITSSDIKFSDYSLGSIYEYDDEKFLVSGLIPTTQSINGVTGAEFIEANGGADATASILFRAAAIDDLKDFQGVVKLLDKANGRTQTFYVAQDRTYPSDVDEYSNGDFLIAESSFADASGRLVRLDAYGNVTWNYGEGTFNIINDAKVLNDDNIIVSV